MKYTSPSYIKEVLNKYGFSPLKRFGQNFLIDENIVAKIVAVADIEDKNVIEVGPGLGALTSQLVILAKKLVAVEIDHGFFGYLTEEFKQSNNTVFVNQDILQTDIKALTSEHFDETGITLVANLPYYITSAVIMYFLQADINLKRVVVMVQKEVAERLCASSGSKNFGALTAIVNYFGTPTIEMAVKATCFLPEPNVDSSVVSIVVNRKSDVNSDKFINFARACFAMKRKTLVNNLIKAGYAKPKVLAALASLGEDERVRAEALSTEKLIALTNTLTTQKNI